MKSPVEPPYLGGGGGGGGDGEGGSGGLQAGHVGARQSNDLDHGVHQPMLQACLGVESYSGAVNINALAGASCIDAPWVKAALPGWRQRRRR